MANGKDNENEMLLVGKKEPCTWTCQVELPCCRNLVNCDTLTISSPLSPRPGPPSCFIFPLLLYLLIICPQLPIAPYSFPSAVEGMMAMEFVDWDNDTVKIAEKAAKEADQVVVIKTIDVSPPFWAICGWGNGLGSDGPRVKHSWEIEPTHNNNLGNTSSSQLIHGYRNWKGLLELWSPVF